MLREEYAKTNFVSVSICVDWSHWTGKNNCRIWNSTRGKGTNPKHYPRPRMDASGTSTILDQGWTLVSTILNQGWTLWSWTREDLLSGCKSRTCLFDQKELQGLGISVWVLGISIPRKVTGDFQSPEKGTGDMFLGKCNNVQFEIIF